MASTTIEWAQKVWNPVTGCTKISDGCKNCYAERMARRICHMGHPNYVNGFVPTTHPHELATPAKWQKPQRIFVCSMSDLFHPDVPCEFIHDVFRVMNGLPRHIFMTLTKRAMIMASYRYSIPLSWTENIWAGVTIESSKYLFRLEDVRLLQDVTRRYISFEPLLDDVGTLDLTGIHWVIVGGESGPYARPMKKDWVTSIRDQCIEQKVPFFFKHWGGTKKTLTGRLVDGRTWDQIPEGEKNG